MNTSSISYNEAEKLRKNKQFKEACGLFEKLWLQEPNNFIAWRYANCLRKLGKLAEGDKICREALTKFPEDKYIKAELGWIIYEKDLKPARENSHLNVVTKIADEILALSSDPLIKSKVVMAVIKAAKEKKDWNAVLIWANKINPEELSGEAIENTQKNGMSEREIWFVNRSRALLELGRYEESRHCAQAGLQFFPNEIFLKRTAALALYYSGDIENSAIEMRALLSHPRCDWYIKAELAAIEYQRENYQEAYRLICQAVGYTRQNIEYKVDYFLTLAKIALELGKLEAAYYHIQLIKVIRKNQNWSMPTEVYSVEKKINGLLRTQNKEKIEPTADLNKLVEICRREWQKGKEEGIEFIRGTLKDYPPDRKYSFIKRDDEGEDVFVLVKDLPKNCTKPGSRVEFTLEKRFDEKKKRESFRATNVRCV